MKVLEIGLPCSPSKRIEDKVLTVTEVLITFGGGMGGSSRKYYVMSIEDNKYTLVSGEVIKLNPRFIVSEREVRIVKQVIEANSLITEFILLKHGEEYNLLDKYDDRCRDRKLTNLV
jgi:hypothetical protein